MKITSAGITVRGKVRLNNEDNFYIDGYYKEDCNADSYAVAVSKAKSHHVYAVCDGMGGYSSGEDASLKAIETLKNFDNEQISEHLEELVMAANGAVCAEVKKGTGDKAGTTLAMAVVQNDKASFCNLGDSRTYLFRNNELIQISVDHTRAQSMVNAEIMSAEEARSSKESHILTQYVGIYESEFVVCPTIKQGVQLMPEDIIVICSDGVSDLATDGEMQQALVRVRLQEPKDIAVEMTALAYKNGGTDNITAVVVKVD